MRGEEKVERKLNKKIDRALAHHCLEGLGSTETRPCPIVELRTAMDGSGTDCEGRTPLARLEALIDEVMVQYLDYENTDTADARLRGVLYGLCWSVALIKNPYYPDLDAVKAAASRRYEAREDGE